MKKIYQIPKSQMIVITIFSIIGEFVILISLSNSSDYYDGNSGFLGFLSLFLPFIYTFYFVGWKHYHKKSVSSVEIKNHTNDQSALNVTNSENLRFCTECGQKNSSNSSYCIACGYKFTN